MERTERVARLRPVNIFWITVFAIIFCAFLAFVAYRVVDRLTAPPGVPIKIDMSATPKYEYPNESTDPEHFIKIIGSEEVYEKLINSKLLWRDPYVLNDPGNPIYGIPPTPWVVFSMHGYITNISLAKRIITINADGDQISFWVRKEEPIMLEFMNVLNSGGTIEFSEIKNNDCVRVNVFINSGNLDLPEARGVWIERIKQ